MAKVIPKLFNNFRGLDLRSTDTNRGDDFATVMSDCQVRKSGALEKRKGIQARAATIGGHGTFKYNNINQTTGAVTQELLVADDRLRRRDEATFTITYAGINAVTVSVKGDSTNSAVFMTIVDGGTEVLSHNLGKGFDEASPVTLAALKTAVDAVSDFTSAITGTTTIPAAFLKFQDGTMMSSATTTLAIKAYEWEEVNRTVSSGPFAGSETNKDDADFENVSSANVNGLLYLSNGYDAVQKYDGQTLFNAGCPKPTRPALTNTASGGGAAEVTDVTTRAEAGVAQIQTVVCVADTRDNEIKEVRFDFNDDQTGIDYNSLTGLDHYFWIFTPTEDIAIWYYVTDGAPGNQEEPVPPLGSKTPDRFIQVDVNSTDDRDAVALATQIKINADSDFTAAIGSEDNYVVITTVANGETNGGSAFYPAQMPGLFQEQRNQNGTEGLHQKYFTLKDEDGSVAFWYDLDTTGIEPSHGADRAVEITTVSAGDAANTVASSTSTAVNADSKFSTSVLTDTVTVTNSSLSDVGQDIDAGTSGFTLAVTTDGEDSLHETYFILYEGENVSSYHNQKA